MVQAERDPEETSHRRAAAAVAKYREDMLKWEEKMIAQDNVDVVPRKNMLISPHAKDVALPPDPPPPR